MMMEWDGGILGNLFPALSHPQIHWLFVGVFPVGQWHFCLCYQWLIFLDHLVKKPAEMGLNLG